MTCRILIILLAGSALPAWGSGVAGPWQDTVEGHWEGAVEIPGNPLLFMVDLKRDGDAFTGTIDIPSQGGKDVPLSDVSVEDGKIRFAIPNVPGNPAFEGKIEGASIKGVFTQSGASAPFYLSREKAVGPKRPQEPQPPFPYREEEGLWQNGDITLAGTLTLPKGSGPFPAALLITGSGSQDRNSELLGHKPFLVWADYLTRAGIAVLRVDDRGVGGSSGSVMDSTTADFAEDALAGVAWLRQRPEIDPDRVGLIGHSEGGIVAPIAAVRSPDVAFIVLLAGPTLPGKDIVLHQVIYGLEKAGSGPAEIDKQRPFYKQALENAATMKDLDRLKSENAKLMSALFYAMPERHRQAAGLDREAFVAQNLGLVEYRWYRYFLGYDPRVDLAKVNCPTLALFGELDFQVDPALNRPEVERALAKAPAKDVVVKTLPGLNHLFQKATTGDGSEYGVIEETVNPAVLALVRDWILERFGKP